MHRVPTFFEHWYGYQVGKPFIVQPGLEVPIGPSLVGPSRACVAPPSHRSSTFMGVLQELLDEEGVVRRAAI